MHVDSYSWIALAILLSVSQWRVEPINPKGHRVYDGIVSHLELLDCQTKKNGRGKPCSSHTHQQVLLLASRIIAFVNRYHLIPSEYLLALYHPGCWYYGAGCISSQFNLPAAKTHEFCGGFK